ncbi:MAG: DMT family transporter, partial [Bacteroidota bacterium]
MTDTNKAYLQLHIAVFLWGFTAILGALIELPALSLVWWRVLLTSLSLVFFVQVGKLFRGGMPVKNLLQFAFVGVLTGLHWLAFYGAIKLANASISLICMATTAFFTALVEPLILRTRIKKHEVFLGLLIVPGMVLIVENVEVEMRAGVWVGLAAALLAAVFGTLNKKWVNNAEPFPITFVEMASAWLFLSLAMPFYLHAEPSAKLLPGGSDFLLLIVLALLCTTFTWWLALRSLKHLS